MKKVVLLAALVMPMTMLAQKEIKPSLPKAQKAFKDKKLDEAKSIIDVTTESQEFMLNKEGQPSKKAAEAWFYKGMIYIAIDTGKNEAFKTLAPDAFKIGVESFDKAKALTKDNMIDFHKN